MKILVCVKQVPDTSGRLAVNPDGTLNRALMQTIINPRSSSRTSWAAASPSLPWVLLPQRVCCAS